MQIIRIALISMACTAMLAVQAYPRSSEKTALASEVKAAIETGEDSTVNNVPANTSLPKESDRQTVGLVLSGGGAKGIAHVGVIKALEDNDIPIDYITGTSMGAIVGSLYACGWSPERMLKFFTSPNFSDWSTGTINKRYIYYYDQPRPTPQWLSVNVNFRHKESLSSQIIPTSLISPLPMNIEFLRLYAPYTEQCDENFNRLFVPFRCVASDVYHKHKVVFGQGSLGDAVRASMSFPMVFRPITVDGVLLYDGGIYDNFPVDVMRSDFKPDIMIGVSVSGADSKPIRGDMYSQLEDMIIQNNDYSLPAAEGIKIQVPVLSYGVLQFDKARTIYDIGYKTAIAMIDSIKSRVTARRPLREVTARRKTFASDTPELVFDSVSIEGLEGSQARYLRYLFTNDTDEPFGIDRTVGAYYRAVTDGSLSNLVPQAEFGGDGRNTLLLEATPKRPWTLGIGGYVTTSTNSMLYFNAGYHTMGHNSLDASVSAWLGQAYFAGMLNAKFSVLTLNPSYFELTGVLSKQKFYEDEVLFFKSSSAMFTTEIDNFLRLGYVWAIGRSTKGYSSIAGGYMSDSYYSANSAEKGGRNNRLQIWATVLRAGIEQNSFDNQMFPSTGRQLLANLDLSYQYSRFRSADGYIDGRGWKHHPVVSLELLWKQFFSLGRNVTLGAMGSAYGTLQSLNQNYTNTLTHARAFAPTPATQNYFNLAFRADNYLAAGLIPIWSPVRRLQLRGDFYVFQRLRYLENRGETETARYGHWFDKTRFICEIAAICNLPFASVSVYANYLSAPASNWNFGISIGLLFKAPKLLH